MDEGRSPSRTCKDDSQIEVSARSPSPSRRLQQPSAWASPGKAAAAAAAAAAKEAARAAAASVRAAEVAADAAEAAEAAAEAEEEAHTPSPKGPFRSPPSSSEYRGRDRRSPARSAFRLSDGDKEGPTESHMGNGSPKRCSPQEKHHSSTYRVDQEGGGGRGDGDSHQGRVGHREEDEGFGGKDDDCRRRETKEGRSSEEEMLKKARDQVDL